MAGSSDERHSSQPFCREKVIQSGRVKTLGLPPIPHGRGIDEAPSGLLDSKAIFRQNTGFLGHAEEAAHAFEAFFIEDIVDVLC